MTSTASVPLDPRDARNSMGGSRLLRWALVGLLAGCGNEPEGGEAPREGEACSSEGTSRCGLAGGSDAVLNCENGSWAEAVACGAGEQCADEPARDAVSCTDINDLHVYAQLHGPCAVAAAQACSFDRDFTLQCDGGEWQIETNCGTNVQACTLIDAGDDPSCTRDDGCIVCR